jgi:ABC-type branched-subunit amino acid transport system ATPase component
MNATTTAGTEAMAVVCTDVSIAFGGVQALKDVSLNVPRGQIVSLIGPNGAGKTTLFNCISGFLRPERGEIWFAGERIDGQPPHRIARRGLVRTFQSIRMFEDFTVLESVLAAQFARRDEALRGWGGRSLEYLRRSSGSVDEARESLRLLGLEGVQDRRCTDLPLLGQRKVEVARAIARRPAMVLFDEPSAGATRSEAAELMKVIETLHDRQVTVFLIEHNVPFVMGVSESIWVMDFGEIVAQGTPAEIQSHDVVREIYLGGERRREASQ